MIDSTLRMIKPGKHNKDILKIFIRRVAERNIVFGIKPKKDELYRLLDRRKEGVNRSK